MTEIIPAIDLIDGKCVRLTRGDFADKTVYSGTPLDTARRFEEAGLTRLHVVDLDGAKTGTAKNLSVLETLCRGTTLKIDFGGGLRDTAAISRVFDLGVAQVSCGSIAIKNPALFADWLQLFGPERFLLAADFKDGFVVSHGWATASTLTLREFLTAQIKLGVTSALCTDVSRDGLLQGPAHGVYQQLKADFPGLGLIASGGVSTSADIEKLCQLKLSGVIVGKAFYEGRVPLTDLSRLQRQYAN